MRPWLAAAACATITGAAWAAPAKLTFKTEDQKSLYLLGAAFGQKLADLSLSSAELEYVNFGLQDVAQGKEPRVDPAAYNSKLQTMIQTRREKRAAEEKVKAEAFMKKAAEEKGAVKTESGLVYVVLKPGDGPQATLEQGAKFHYKSSLPSGKVLEDTAKRGAPAEFAEPLKGLIPCWREALTLMKTGARLKVACPSTLTYGDVGNPMAGVPGGSAVVFEFELLEVLKPLPEAPKPTKK